MGIKERLERQEPLFGSWYVGDEIGEGSYGRVYRISRRDGLGNQYTAALKAIEILAEQTEKTSEDLAAKVKRDYMGEVQTLVRLRGAANVVYIEDYDLLENRENGQLLGCDLLIRMEELEGVSRLLVKDASLRTQKEAHRLGMDICRALMACDAADYIHRDIKPGNLFRSPFGDYKLGDFGVAKQLAGTIHAKTAIGTEPYAAPEVHEKNYDARVDTYSLGLVLYQLMNDGFLPFYNAETGSEEQKRQAIMRRLSGEVLPPPAQADTAFQAVILKACAFQPEDRFHSAEEMYHALRALEEQEKPIVVQPQRASTPSIWQAKEENNLFLSTFGLSFSVTPEMRYMAQQLTGNAGRNSKSGVLTPRSAARLPAWRIRAPWFPFNELTVRGYSSIADRAFRGRKDLLSFRCSGSVKTIGAEAFIHCSNLSEIHCAAGLAQVMDGAFSDCIRLARCHLPDTVQLVGSRCFAGCGALAALRLSDRLQRLPDQMCDGCTALQQVTLPSALCSIGQAAFRGSGLHKILLPDSCVQLGDAAFAGCKKLVSVQMSLRMAVLPKNCFAGCASLAQIDLPFQLVEIHERAFYGCMALTQVVIPEGVRSIGGKAFARCDNLSMLRVPQTVAYIGEDAFPIKRKLRSKLLVVTKKGSYAWDYCKQYGIRVKEEA